VNRRGDSLSEVLIVVVVVAILIISAVCVNNDDNSTYYAVLDLSRASDAEAFKACHDLSMRKWKLKPETSHLPTRLIFTRTLGDKKAYMEVNALSTPFLRICKGDP
jgi:hypothetical protein